MLVVDDNEYNRELLRDLLSDHSYEIAVATDGKEALTKAAEAPPDVVLLDIMMPKLDGFEVCRRLKADPATASIPVLMITGLGERNNRLKGIDAGADEFLTKPVDVHEVALRVRNAVRTKRLHDSLQEELTRATELAEERDSLTHMIVHDMRGPLAVVHGYHQLFLKRGKEQAGEKPHRWITSAEESCRELTAMASSLLDVSRLESAQMPVVWKESDLGAILRRAADSCAVVQGAPMIRVDLPPDPPTVACDSALIGRTVMNLVGNAIRFTPRDGSIVIGLRCNAASVQISVADSGAGIAPQHHRTIFEKFRQAPSENGPQEHTTGLGLTFCKLAVEAHGGTIGVESEIGKGSTFWFEIPHHPIMVEGTEESQTPVLTLADPPSSRSPHYGQDPCH